MCLQCRRPWFNSWVGKIPWRRYRLLTPVFLGFPGGSDSKESTCNAGDLGSIPGLGRPPGEGKGYPLQHSGLEKSLDCMGSQRVRQDWATFTSLSIPDSHPISPQLLTLLASTDLFYKDFFNAHFGIFNAPFHLLAVATSELQIWAFALFLFT